MSIVADYITTLPDICEAIEKDNSFYLGGLIKMLHDTLKEKGTLDYIHIVKEFAKLNRFELRAVKERLLQIIQTEVSKHPLIMKRCASLRTNCGFVVMKLNPKNETHHFEALKNFTLIFKYKWKLSKCIGLIVKHENEYLDLDWCYVESDWIYDNELQALVEQEIKIFANPAIEHRPWYGELHAKKK